ncbi:hypothetical protein [uncultured Shewanella sp.]|uniref:hypothetical protein n=1 Tax=uncultured Shewanella sp. TaxID=173975 RepID=UPI00260D49BA|nr:hypothetical protein [uncultured Shewanella sp.]
MIRMILILILSIFYQSVNAYALQIDNLKFYQTNYNYDTKKEDIIAYVLKDDPCITVQVLPNKKTKRYCQMGKSGLNLEQDSPTIYVTDLYVSPGSISFIVAAPWNEQQCQIMPFTNEINCEPTGR